MYTVEVTNRFKGLDLLDRVPEELWMEAHDVVQEAVIKIGYLPTWGVPLSVSYHFTFSYYSWGSQGKNTEVVFIPFSSGPHSVRPLQHEQSVLGGPTWHGLVSLS